MLIRFTVDNFLSFNSEQEFSMNAGTATTFEDRVSIMPDQSILKFTALYGANASGKTNLVKAIDFSRKIIVDGINYLNTNEKHYKLKEENLDAPTKFEYDIKIDDKYYGYGFSISLKDKKILNEWLVELKKSGDSLIYERESASKYLEHEIKFENIEEKNKFDLQIELVNDIENVLLISEVSRRKNNPSALKILEKIYNWFRNDLVIIYPNSIIGDMTNIFKKSDDRLVELLKYFDTGICGFKLQPSSIDQVQQYMPKVVFENLKNSLENTRKMAFESKEEDKNIMGKGILRLENHLYEIKFNKEESKMHEVLMHEILFHHNDSDITFAFGEESNGTRRLIELIDIIYNDSKNRTVIIDELDRSLHPQMTIKFVETFLKYSKNLITQLIITTHESNLMDLKMLRRDEIWFVERDLELNESKLYSLEKFKVHNTKKVAKDYLIGRYGAVPVFKDFDSYLGESNANTKI
ncbi:ATP/GTP-binding protein [Fusibacter sp. 3D3]|uniref:AAA family ATPase n=1 Tax=Fusibacter sp. 3D3 TaxID=1048380 RepID=UPI00085374EA|nr:ATP-binding protein [Fusibacter sp. 3D3]GAU78646.1 hypothetical protein F3D3_3281 [Fusibacter sp. 3D3]